MECEIYHSDNLQFLQMMPNKHFDLIYIDPPFNTGKTQSRGGYFYSDEPKDYLSFLRPRLEEGYRVLSEAGSFFLHVDCREAHYCKVLLDQLFGRECFMNEIIWAYDYGGRSKRKWPAKHDTIFWYAKDPNHYTFHYAEMDRIPYMAPGLAGKERAARGKTPTDVWWHTIVSPTGKEKTGYPTQKPLGILRRIVKVHSSPGDLLLDFFAGSGSFGQAALSEGRSVVLVDSNGGAVNVMQRRLPGAQTYRKVPGRSRFRDVALDRE